MNTGGHMQELERAQRALERLRDQLKEIGKELSDKEAELTRAQMEQKNLEDLLQAEIKHLQEIDAVVARLEEELRQAKIKLDTALERLRQLTEHLHQQQQLELQMQRAYEAQVTATNLAQDRANEADRREREAKHAADKAIREQKQAEAIVASIKSELNDAEISLAWALAALATALLIPIAGEIAAIPILATIAALEVAIFALASKLNRAENTLSQANSMRDRALELHETSKTEKQKADETLTEEKNKLATAKTNWDKQIEAKNAAKKAVETQTEVVTAATNHFKNVERQLADSKEQQTKQRTKVHNVEMQVKEKTVQVAQLKMERGALQLRQEQTQDAFNQANTVFIQATIRDDKATRNLKDLKDKNEAKRGEIQEMKDLVDKKKAEVEKARADHLLAERKAQEAKNEVGLIKQDLETAAKSATKSNEQIEAQKKMLIKEEEKSNTLARKKEILKEELENTRQKKEQLENRVQDLNKQLKIQNEAMMEKNNEVYNISTNLESKKQKQSQIEIHRIEHIAHAKRIQEQIADYQQVLDKNHADLEQAKKDKDTQENAQQVAKDSVTNTNQSLQRIRNDLKWVSENMHDKEEVYKERTRRHNNLTRDIKGSQAVQVNMDRDAQNLHDQWTSKRIWMTNAVNDVKEMRQNIAEIKKARRSRVQEISKKEEITRKEENNNVQVKQQKNYNKNISST
ncbi:unnamed protein product [Rotaria socialis]|uniref:Uncharacterized protein n=1 Tax=Rotaria socialis TaxID=392032 RepID=A0A818NA95_9BILA|nr:unnamed protein product [Rotaria socialis]CAF3603213.1 unnamed protein product [Rotaria socialis]CAF4542875.1 unnamed protein product [Rotaria socialis]CAF4606990.1 unnamed protein product [Rotaria socialis]